LDADPGLQFPAESMFQLFSGVVPPICARSLADLKGGHYVMQM
jgi:hypothetical protein